MNGTCELCGAPASAEISAKVSPPWGSVCEPVQMFACEQHLDAVWKRINQDFTLSQPHVLLEKKRKHRVMPTGHEF